MVDRMEHPTGEAGTVGNGTGAPSPSIARQKQRQRIVKHLSTLRAACPESEYRCHIKMLNQSNEDTVIPTTQLVQADDIVIREEGQSPMYKQPGLRRFSPDDIEPVDWWEACHQYFPLLSICGAEVQDLQGALKVNTRLLEGLGVGQAVVTALLNRCEEPTLLEIGPGYGILYDYLMTYVPWVRYTGVDVVAWAKDRPAFHGHVVIGNGRSIPKEVGTGFEVVASCNTFQHLTPNIRRAYFHDISRVLAPKGIAIITTFIHRPALDHLVNVPSTVDENGRRYVSMLEQRLMIDTEDELLAMIGAAGLRVTQMQEYADPVKSLKLCRYELEKKP